MYGSRRPSAIHPWLRGGRGRGEAAPPKFEAKGVEKTESPKEMGVDTGRFRGTGIYG